MESFVAACLNLTPWFRQALAFMAGPPEDAKHPLLQGSDMLREERLF